jgi:hypothetical protein
MKYFKILTIVLTLMLVSNLFAGRLSYKPWYTNAQSGLDPSKVYTHKVTYTKPAADFNGVHFNLYNASMPDDGGATFTLAYGSGTTKELDGYMNLLETGFSFDIVNGFLYDCFDYQLTLKGLTSGQHYRFTLYNRVFGNAYRPAAIYGDDMPEPTDLSLWTIDQSIYGYGNGMLIYYDYIADADGQILIHIKSTTDPSLNASWLLFGFSNEKTAALSGPNITTNLETVTSIANDQSRDLIVGFDCDTTPTVQWFKNNVSVGSGILTNERNNGQYTASYNPGIVDEADNGDVYKCVITDGHFVSVERQTTVNVYTRKMVAYWTFDNYNSGMFDDSSDEGYDALIIDSEPASLALVTGKFGQAATFSGYYATAGNWNPAPAGEMTISFWLKHTGNTSVILSKEEPNALQWRVIASSDNRIFFDDGNWQPQTDSGVLIPGQWQHICLVENGNRHSIYVDGNLKYSMTGPYGEHPDSLINLGGSYGGGWNTSTVVDDLKIFNYAFDANLVQQIMTKGYVCQNLPIGDINGDCLIDFKDFAVLAENWFACNRYPETECNN